MAENKLLVVNDLLLGLMRDDEIPEIEHVHLGTTERIEGVRRRFHDRLSL